MLVALGLAPSACGSGDAKSSTSSSASPAATTASGTAKASAAASAASQPAASASAASAGAFIRERPLADEQHSGPDACAYIGGLGFNCVDALLEEKDPVKQRYMRRMSDADARQAWDALKRGEPNGVAHGEMALLCAASGPCGKTDKSGAIMDDGYACLTAAEGARDQKDDAGSKAAHARACKCDPRRAQIPVMGGFLACDGKDKPVERGQNLTTEEAADVRACAECDPDKGPAACAKEIKLLASSDAELAKYIETVHIPRCQKR